MKTSRVVAVLWSYVRPYRGIAALTLATMALEAALEVLLRLSFKVVIDDAIGKQDRQLLTVVLIAMVLGAIVSALVGLLQDYLNARLETSVLCDLRQRMFDRLQQLSMSFHARADVGGVLAHFTSDLTAVETALYVCLGGGGITAVLLVVGGLPPLFWLDARLGLIVLAGLPILVGSSLGLARRVADSSHRVQEGQAELLSRVQESLAAQATVKLFRLEAAESARFSSALRRFFDTSQRSNLLQYAAYRAPNAVVALVSVVVLAVGADLVLAGELGLGALVSFQVTLTQVMSAVRDLSSRAPTLFRSVASLERVEALLETTPSVEDPPVSAAFPSEFGAIRFDDVKMAYDGAHPSLAGVNLEIPRGARVAFVGSSGSGKSTALGLLLRFYDPVAGSIRFDDCDLRTLRLATLRGELSAVFQDSFLFNTTVLQNIRMGRPDASEAEVIEAAKTAEVHEAILALTHGYQTVVGERGSNLSGGQRQRIALARALLSRPRILLLDEATSALDAATEAALNETLDGLSGGRTVISVTHRLRSATKSDRIFVFEAGRVIEEGDHASLLARRGAYARLWQKQAGLGDEARGGARVEAARLASIPLFAGLDPALLASLAPLFVTEQYGPGSEIVRAGEAGDRFYIIARGSVVVEKDRVRIARLEDGDYFGEVALLRPVSRNATVRSVANTTVLSLRRDQLLGLVERSPATREALERAIVDRA